jgi:N-acetylglucosamine malate deacetylase 1
MSAHSNKLDILVFAAHPDDAELACAGTIARHIAKGYKVGIVDLTAGELGTRGSEELRSKEAAASATLLKLSIRECLHLADGFFEENQSALDKIIYVLRKYQPTIVIANALHDRHPDHGRGGDLVSRACFLSGLSKIKTQNQEAWRPQYVYRYIQDRYIKPDFIVDISEYWDIKIAAIKSFSSQFYDPNSEAPETYISSADFMQFIEARSLELGHAGGFKYGEGFTVEKALGIQNLFDLH